MKYKCSNCGNILSDSASFCGKCGGCIIDSVGSISLGFDFEEGSYIPKKVAFVNPEELRVANLIAKELDLEVAHRTDAYTSILYKDCNVAKVEWTKGEVRIHILMTKENKKKYIDNPMFAIQTNKNQVLWKTKYDESKLQLYLELIRDGMKLGD